MSRTKKRMRGVDIDTNMLVLFRIREAEDLHSIHEWLAHHPSTRFHPWQFVEEALSQAHSKRKKASSPLDHSCLAGDLAEVSLFSSLGALMIIADSWVEISYRCSHAF